MSSHDHWCERSGKAVLDGGYAICPGCHHVVKVKLVDGLWTFMPHNEDGFPEATRGQR